MKVPHEGHQKDAPKSVKIALITVSSSRYQEVILQNDVDDESRSTANRIVQRLGHETASLKLVDDDIAMIRREVLRSVYDEDVDAIILMGGTGLAKRDVTIEAVTPLLDKELDGFGEIFRRASYEKIGSAAILTRTLAGSLKGKIVFCLPGSPQAVETALELVLPELPHMVLISKDN